MPDVHLKLFTASEIHHMSKLGGLTHEEVLRELQATRARLTAGRRRRGLRRPRAPARRPGKEHPDNWFDVHRTAHALGIPTHCTMLYGHVETYEERVDHLLRLRDLQDETGGFLAFIPLAFHPENTVFEQRGWKHTAGSDDLKLIAVSRLLLDNIPNMKAYWIMMGLPLTQIALHFGANDVQGTVVREEIFHAAGAQTETEQKIDELVPRRARGRADPRAARHAVQRAPPMVRLGRISYVNMAPVFHRLDAEVEEVPGVPTELRAAARRRGRRGADPVDRVGAQRRPAAAAAAALRLVRGRGRLDPARLAEADRADPDDRGHARERDVGRAGAGALAERGARPARARRRTRSS